MEADRDNKTRKGKTCVNIAAKKYLAAFSFFHKLSHIFGNI